MERAKEAEVDGGRLKEEHFYSGTPLTLMKVNEEFLSDVGFDKLVDSGNVRALPAIGKVSFFGI